jgi:hypothetical protein
VVRGPQFKKRWSKEFTVLKFGLGLGEKFCLGVYSGEAKWSVLASRVTFVCCWSVCVLLKDRYISVVPRSQHSVFGHIF